MCTGRGVPQYKGCVGSTIDRDSTLPPITTPVRHPAAVHDYLPLQPSAWAALPSVGSGPRAPHYFAEPNRRGSISPSTHPRPRPPLHHQKPPPVFPAVLKLGARPFVCVCNCMCVRVFCRRPPASISSVSFPCCNDHFTFSPDHDSSPGLLLLPHPPPLLYVQEMHSLLAVCREELIG